METSVPGDGASSPPPADKKRSVRFSRFSGCSFREIKKWTILRFGIIFIGAILVLCIIYGLKSTHKTSKTNE